MVDWLNIASNALWLIGSALALAILSIANWSARAKGHRLRDQLALPRQQATLALAGCLVCAGLLATSSAWWEAIPWLILTLALMIKLVRAISAVRKEMR